jgi:quinol monooxygenase YgiN
MYMRLFHLKINPDFLPMLQPFHDKVVIPELQQIEGCLFAGLIQSSKSDNECVSITLWETREQAEAFEKSMAFRSLMEKVKPFLSESTEWKVQLSDDLELKYEPVKEEPVLKEFKVVTKSDITPDENELRTLMYVRMVSIRLKEGKIEAFREKYVKEIVPTLQSTKGCRYIYLLENIQEKNQVISITIWDNKEMANAYERSGSFARLTAKVKDTISDFYQWKLALEKGGGSRVKTSEDIEIYSYGLVSAKRFS